MASKQKKRQTVTEADIEEFIENLDDGEYYPDSEFSDNDDYDENSFCNLSDADENNRDDIRFVRNEASRKLTFETLSETWNEQNYDLLFHQKKFIKLTLEKSKSSRAQQINQMFPENEMGPTLFAITLGRQDV